MFIKEIRYGGIDWHDSNTRSTQLTYNDEFDIPNEKLLESIINKIIEDWNESVKLTKEEFKNVLNKAFIGTEPITIPLLNENGEESNKDESNGEIYYENSLIFYPMKIDENNIICCYDEDYSWGQCSFTIKYYKQEIDDPCYIVQENFLAPTKGCDSVERIYVDIFTSLEEAKKYFESMSIHDKNYNPMGSIKELLVTSYKYVIETDWYKLNKKAIELMKEKNQNPFDNSFCIFVKPHIDNLEKL